jgi:hypothetical protein
VSSALAPGVLPKAPMHATFIQKVLICAFAAMCAAGLIEWGKVFVTGADDALNGDYRKTDISFSHP